MARWLSAMLLSLFVVGRVSSAPQQSGVPKCPPSPDGGSDDSCPASYVGLDDDSADNAALLQTAARGAGGASMAAGVTMPPLVPPAQDEGNNPANSRAGAMPAQFTRRRPVPDPRRRPSSGDEGVYPLNDADDWEDVEGLEGLRGSPPVRGGVRPPLPPDYSCKVYGASGETLTTDMAELCNGTSRYQLPKFDENDDGVFLVSVILGPLSLFSRLYQKNFLTQAFIKGVHWIVPGALHTELMFESKDKKFSIGYFGIDDTGIWALLVGGPGLVSWSPEPCREEIAYYRDYTKVNVGSITAKQLNQWLDWVPEWAVKHPHYNMYSLANLGALGKKYHKFIASSECGDLVEEGIKKMVEIGATIDSTLLICRPYFALLTDGAPVRKPEEDGKSKDTVGQLLLSLETSVTHAIVHADFSHFTDVVRWAFHLTGNFTFVDGLNQSWSYAPRFPFIFPDGPMDNYQRCDLPNLPKNDAVLGECQPFMRRVWDNMILSSGGTKRWDQVCF